MNRVIRSRRQAGQGMTEYIIIVALVAIAAIGVYSYFGTAVRGQMASITSELAGGAGTTGAAAATAAQGKANTDVGTNYTLNNYHTGATTAGQSGG